MWEVVRFSLVCCVAKAFKLPICRLEGVEYFACRLDGWIVWLVRSSWVLEKPSDPEYDRAFADCVIFFVVVKLCSKEVASTGPVTVNNELLGWICAWIRNALHDRSKESILRQRAEMDGDLTDECMRVRDMTSRAE